MPRPRKKLRWHGGQWEFRAQVNGRSIVHRLGDDLTEARRLAKFHEQEVEELKRRPTPLANLTVAQFAEQWLQNYVTRKRVERDHKLARQRMEDHILPRLGRKYLDEVRGRDLFDLAEELSRKDLSVNSQRHILSDARCLFSYAVSKEVIEVNPFVGRRILPPPPKARPQPIPDTDLERIRRLLPEPYVSAFDLAVGTGMRWGEQAGLTWERVDLNDALLHLEDTKDGGGRSIPLDADCVEILARWRDEGHRPYVMPWRPKSGPQWAPLVTKQRAGIKWHWHQTRHTFACHYLRDGGTIEVLSRLLGHSSVTVTERYAALFPETVRAEFRRVRGQEKVGPMLARAT